MEARPVIRFNDWTIDRETLTIRRGNLICKFKNQGTRPTHLPPGVHLRFSIVEHMLLSGGRTTYKALFARFYDHDRDGGPLMGHGVIKVVMSEIKMGVLPQLHCVLEVRRKAGENWYGIKTFSVTEAAQKIRDVVRRTA